jgi:gamma-glutamyltranspeptidase/glutathione hydrolase
MRKIDAVSAPRRPGMVAAPQAEAAHEGARVLSEGGNAADALVTAALVQGVTDPHRSGLGGFGCASLFWVKPASGSPAGSERARRPEGPKSGGESPLLLSVAFHGRAGSLSKSDQWRGIFEYPAPDGFGYVVKGKVNDAGYQAITTPGMLAGLAAIHSRFGRKGWRELVERAVPYAEEGFLVGPGLAEFWIRPGLHGRVSTRERIGLTESGRAICLKPDGSTFKPGDLFIQKDLAKTYRRIAAGGAEEFYRGAIAAEITADWKRGGALTTGDDLRSYRAVEEPPLVGSYRGLPIVTSPLPGGGPSLLQALRLIEEIPPARLSRTGDLPHNSPEALDRIARVLRVVWADRLQNHGDPAFGSASAEELLSSTYLEKLRAAAAASPAAAPRSAETGGTTHLSIVDGEGNAISFSHSLGYGSGVFTPSLGFMYNNCMSGFDPVPGSVNSIAPGKARSTAVAETIVLKHGSPFLVLGSPGGARITAALVQVIVSVVDFGMSAAEAAVAPRFDGYGERTLFLESRFPLPVVAELRRRGWEVTQSPKPFGMVGRVYAVEVGADGRLHGAVDPGEPGAAVSG